MISSSTSSVSGGIWTLKKAVTTLAIAPQTESLTRSGRMAYNVMIFKSQRMSPDAEGGHSAPLSEIVKGYNATTRDSKRVRGYIEQMCSTVVKWFPLSSSDTAQPGLSGMEELPADTGEEGRIFSLLSEARFTKRSGEQWVTWFFPPTIREMLIEPSRWAQIDIKELAALSHYAGVALYEICARYKDVPGGLTNRAAPPWWQEALRSDPDTKPREWRKFKNETVKPAIAEINQRTGLDVKLVEYKQGRAVVGVQFAVKRKPREAETLRANLELVDFAEDLGIREKDFDQMVDEFGEEKIRKALESMRGRLKAQPSVPIANPLAYLKKSLKNGLEGPLFDQQFVPIIATEQSVGSTDKAREWISNRQRQLNDELDQLSNSDLARIAALAQASLSPGVASEQSLLKRFNNKQYRSPLIWALIKSAYAVEKYGANWDRPPCEEDSFECN